MFAIILSDIAGNDIMKKIQKGFSIGLDAKSVEAVRKLKQKNYKIAGLVRDYLVQKANSVS